MSTDAARNTVDVAAIGITAGTLLQVLPHVSAAGQGQGGPLCIS